MATELWAKVVHVWWPEAGGRFGTAYHLPDSARPCAAIEYLDDPPRVRVKCHRDLTTAELADCAKYGAFPVKDGTPSWERGIPSKTDADSAVSIADVEQ